MGLSYEDLKAILREIQPERQPTPPHERVDSIGTCTICGYFGPGPKHDCTGPKDRKRKRIEVLMEDE